MLMNEERELLMTSIRKVYLDRKEFEFDTAEEEELFLKHCVHYIEDEFQSEGHFRYTSLQEFSCDWRADAIINGVATKDYHWFMQ